MLKLTFLLIFPFFCYAQNLKLDAANGYANFKFGSSPKDFTDLSIEIDEGKTKLYSVAKPVINIDGIVFDYIRLTFLNNKLCTISMQTKNLSAFKMLQFLKESYGIPVQISKTDCEWKGKSVNVICNITKGIAVIDFYSKKIK